MRCCWLLVYWLLAGLCWTAELPPELLFKDTFDTTKLETDINIEAATRQSGRHAPLSYRELEITQAGKNEDPRTFLDGSLKKLITWPRNGGPYQHAIFIPLAPNLNFTNSPRFIIECKVEPLINDPADTSSDWVGITFGASSPLHRPEASDGISLLFRSNKRLTAFGGRSSTPLTEKDGLPAGEFRVRIEVEAVDFDPTSPVTVQVKINDTLFHTFTRPEGMLGNYVSLLSYCSVTALTGTGSPETSDQSWINSFDDLSISAIHCIRVAPHALTLRRGEISSDIKIQVPPALTATTGTTVEVKNHSPEILGLEGTATDKLLVPFNQGETSKTIRAVGRKKGRGTLQVLHPGGICVNRPVELTVTEHRLLNTSFELDPPMPSPGIGPLTGWQAFGGGQTGLDAGEHGYANNGLGRDGQQVAFIQGPSSLTQTAYGLVPGQSYWLQIVYNASQGRSAPDLTAKVNNQLVGHQSQIPPTGEEPYHFINIPFQVGGSEAFLEIANTSDEPDAVLLLDTISVVPRTAAEPVVLNPSFEASGDLPLPHYFQFLPLAGWQMEGIVGLDQFQGTVADNGQVPDQEHVLFLRGLSYIEQRLPALESGGRYEISVRANAKSGTSPRLKISVNETALLESNIPAAGSNQPYAERRAQFLATTASPTLRLEQMSNDNSTLLLDDIRLTYLGPGQVRLTIQQQAGTIRLSWPSHASFMQLQFSENLGGSWQPVSEAPMPNGSELEIYLSPAQPRRFFRLISP